MSSSASPQLNSGPNPYPASATALLSTTEPSETPSNLQPTTTTTSSAPRTLHIGTRASALALAQTTLFTTLLYSSSPHTPYAIHPTTTTGDQIQTTPLHTLAQTGKSLWTEELEVLLLRGDIDCIVHSLKDVPTKLPKGCKVSAVGPRGSPGDVVVMRAGRPGGATTLAELPPGSVVGTSSVRRAAMIRRRYPSLVLADVRGNIGTRLRKLGDPALNFDCLILAGAGVMRLGLQERISSWIGRAEGMMRAVGQGAVGVEVREEDEWVEGLMAGQGVRVRRVGWECVAERSLLRTVEGGCSVPVGVETEWEDLPAPDPTSAEHQHQNQNPQTRNHEDPGPGLLHLRATVVSLDGTACVEAERSQRVGSDEEAEECGWEVARLLVEKGAGEILKEIGLNRGMIEGMDGA